MGYAGGGDSTETRSNRFVPHNLSAVVGPSGWSGERDSGVDRDQGIRKYPPRRPFCAGCRLQLSGDWGDALHRFRHNVHLPNSRL